MLLGLLIAEKFVFTTNSHFTVCQLYLYLSIIGLLPLLCPIFLLKESHIFHFPVQPLRLILKDNTLFLLAENTFCICL